jgi:hypothetical protein
VEDFAHRPRKVLAGIGEHDGSTDSAEQRLTEFLLQQLDLMTDRRMGKMQLIGCQREAREPRRSLEPTQRAQAYWRSRHASLMN